MAQRLFNCCLSKIGMKKLSLKASCLCGGIQLRTHGYHRDVENCHCIQCMKTHGHYAAYTNVQEQNVKFLKKRKRNIKKKNT